jgi:hypothetical protein
MQKLTFSRSATRGSALLATMIIVMVLSVAALGIMDYSLDVYRTSLRQALTDQAKVISDGEMENLYYTWKDLLLKKTAVANVQTASEMTALTSSTSPFCQNVASRFGNMAGQWVVTRSIAFNAIGTGDGSAEGIVNGNLIGKNYYFTAETSASITLPLVGTIKFDSGRHFAYSSTPLFQYAVFYQGNLEMAAGGNMNITGPVSTNASAYLGSAPGYALQLADTVSYFQYYNGSANPTAGETDWLEGNSNLVDPIYNPDPSAAAPADQAAQRAIQVQKMSSQASFVGGVDVAADIANPDYAAAYTNLQGVVDPNEIYRAVIAPPPTAADGTLLDEDPVVAASRMYNTAGMLVTIDASNGTPVIHVGDHTNPSQYDSLFPTITNPTGLPTDVIQNVRSSIVDPREYLNGASNVNLTTLNVGNLNTALAAARTTSSTFRDNYNGVLYIYDKTNNASAQVNDPNGLNGIRITNATTTPNYPDQNNNPLGFTVVSNNGVYVQGDYNTTPITVSGSATPVNNPSAIMGDAVTVLSQGWSLTNNATLQPITTGTPNRQATASTGTTDGMTVNAAILTGNTPSTATSNSGGAQNLVRMIEDWYYPVQPDGTVGLTLNLNGSLGQLFTSKYFSSKFAPGQQSGLGSLATGGYNQVYIQPRTRNLTFDTGFRDRTPAGAPTTTAFTRGDFFFW